METNVQTVTNCNAEVRVRPDEKSPIMNYSEIAGAFKQGLHILGNVHKQKINDISVDDLSNAIGAAFEEYDKQRNSSQL